MADNFKYTEKEIDVYHGTYQGYLVEPGVGLDMATIKSIDIPDEYNGRPVIEIGMFNKPGDVSALESITIGKNVKFIRNNAFDGHSNLK